MSNSSLKYVDHTYRDFSRYIEDGGQLIKHKKCEANFPAMLHKILSEPRHFHIINWMPHGRAWTILDKELLFLTVLPHYYVCKKYESFTRQLNGWGFKRLHQSGPDLGCYYHECFLRDMPKLTCLIRRLPPNLGKATPYPAGEPNFYRISEKFPLPPLPRSKASAKRSASEAEALSSSAPSHDRSKRSGQHSSLPSINPSTQESSAGFASAASAAQSRGHSHDASTQDQRAVYAPSPSAATSGSGGHPNTNAHHPPPSSTRPSIRAYAAAGLETAPAMPYQPSYWMPHHYPQNHHYYQPSGQSSYFQHAYSNYPPTFGGQHRGQYSNHGWTPQNRHQPVQPPQYHNYPPPHNVAPIEENSSQHIEYGRSHGRVPTAERFRPPSSDHITFENNTCPNRSSRQENHNPIAKPNPPSTKPDQEVEPGGDPPVYNV